MEWYEDEVRSLEKSNAQHKMDRPPVFYGSSSFHYWDTLAEDFAPGVLNLGFGGSTLQSCDYFFDRLIRPVHPRSLLVYAGDNDLGDGRSVEATFGYFQSLKTKVQSELGPIPFGFVSIKPSPARFYLIDRIRQLNESVHREIVAVPNGYYVDVFPLMLNGTGQPNKSLFIEDGLHMNRQGYRVWGQYLLQFENRIFTP